MKKIYKRSCVLTLSFLLFFFIMTNTVFSFNQNNAITNNQIILKNGNEKKLPISFFKILEDYKIVLQDYTPDTINNAGLQLYNGLRYSVADELFRCSLLLDFNKAITHYYRSRSLAMLYSEEIKSMEYLDMLFVHIRRALALDISFFGKLKSEPAFTSLTQLPQYEQMLKDFPLKKYPAIYYEKNFELPGTWLDTKNNTAYTFLPEGELYITSLSGQKDQTNVPKHLYWVYDQKVTEKVWQKKKNYIFITSQKNTKINKNTEYIEIKSFYHYSIETKTSTWFKKGSPILEALKTGEIAVLYQLFSSGININTQLLYIPANENNSEQNTYPSSYEIQTALNYAVKSGSINVLKTLISFGASLNAEDILVHLHTLLPDELKKTTAAFLSSLGFFIQSKTNKKLTIVDSSIHFTFMENFEPVDTIIGTLAKEEQNDLTYSLNITYAFSPDNRYLAYIGNSDKGYDLFLCDTEGNQVLLTRGEKYNGKINWITSYHKSTIQWSSDGNYFILSLMGELWIYIMEIKEFMQLTYPDEGWLDINPVFFDSTTIRFLRGTMLDFVFTGNEYVFNLLTNQTIILSNENIIIQPLDL